MITEKVNSIAARRTSSTGSRDAGRAAQEVETWKVLPEHVEDHSTRNHLSGKKDEGEFGQRSGIVKVSRILRREKSSPARPKSDIDDGLISFKHHCQCRNLLRVKPDEMIEAGVISINGK